MCINHLTKAFLDFPRIIKVGRDPERKKTLRNTLIDWSLINDKLNGTLPSRGLVEIVVVVVIYQKSEGVC